MMIVVAMLIVSSKWCWNCYEVTLLETWVPGGSSPWGNRSWLLSQNVLSFLVTAFWWPTIMWNLLSMTWKMCQRPSKGPRKAPSTLPLTEWVASATVGLEACGSWRLMWVLGQPQPCESSGLWTWWLLILYSRCFSVTCSRVLEPPGSLRSRTDHWAVNPCKLQSCCCKISS